MSLFSENDYDQVTQTVTFLAGTRSAIVFVSTINDGLSEETETFTASISNPSDGLTLGTQSTATVSIFNAFGEMNN